MARFTYCTILPYVRTLSDNTLLAGRTLDYGPFGWMEKYDPMYQVRHYSNTHMRTIRHFILFVLSSFSLIIEVFFAFKLLTRTLYITLLFKFNYPLYVLPLEWLRNLIFWKLEFQTRLFRTLFWEKNVTFHLENPTSPPVLEEVILILFFNVRDDFGKSRA